MDQDEFYHDILGGLAIYYGGSLIRDILRTIRAFPDPRFGHALNPNQVGSKKWLLDNVAAYAGTQFRTVHILGGWYAILAAMLFNDARFRVDRIRSIDIDPACEPVAEMLNEQAADRGRFEAVTADMVTLDWRREWSPGDLIINTSCEHVVELDDWFRRLPAGAAVVLQSNDYFDCPEHVNCVRDLAEFKRQAPLSDVLFEEARPFKKYRRFMLIGYK